MRAKKIDLENFPTSQSAQNMLATVTPGFYDQSYVGKWLYQVMGLECTLTESELAGKSISEIGLYDASNDLVCIKTFTAKGKDDDIQMTYTLDDVF